MYDVSFSNPFDRAMFYVAPLASPMGWRYAVSFLPIPGGKSPQQIAQEAYEKYTKEPISLKEFEKRAFLGGPDKDEWGSPVAQIPMLYAGDVLLGAVVEDVLIPAGSRIAGAGIKVAEKYPKIAKGAAAIAKSPAGKLGEFVIKGGKGILKVLSHPAAPVGFGAIHGGTEYISSKAQGYEDVGERAVGRFIEETAKGVAIQRGFETGMKAGLPVKYREVKMPGKGKPLWKGLALEVGEGVEAVPIVGRTERGLVVGSKGIVEAMRNLPEEAVFPANPTEARIFYEWAKKNLKPKDVRAIEESLVASGLLGKTRSAFINEERLYEATRRLPREAVGDVINTLKTGKWDAMIGGSKAHWAQIKPDIPEDILDVAKARGLDPDIFKPGDIDIDLLSGTPDDALDLANRIYQKWKARGINARLEITPGGTPRIYVKKGGKWEKAVEVLHPDAVQKDLELSSQAIEQAWGIKFQEKPEEIAGVKTLSLGEQVKRKLLSSIGIRKGGTELGPKTWREKDIPTGLLVAESAQESAERSLLNKLFKRGKLKRSREAIDYLKRYWMSRGYSPAEAEEMAIAYFSKAATKPSAPYLPQYYLSYTFSYPASPDGFDISYPTMPREVPSKPSKPSKVSKPSLPSPPPAPSPPSPPSQEGSKPSLPPSPPSFSEYYYDFTYDIPSYPSIPSIPESPSYGTLPAAFQFGMRVKGKKEEKRKRIETVWIPEF